jgi:hypothetical protein
MARYYAVGLVVVVEADDADAAFSAAVPKGETELSSDGRAYVGAVFASPACPITQPMAQGPDWTVEMYYGASPSDIASGRALPLMDGDDT